MDFSEFPGAWRAWLQRRVEALTDDSELQSTVLKTAVRHICEGARPELLAFTAAHPDPRTAPEWGRTLLERISKAGFHEAWWKGWMPFARSCVRRWGVPDCDVEPIAVEACERLVLDPVYASKVAAETARLLYGLIRYRVIDGARADRHLVPIGEHDLPWGSDPDVLSRRIRLQEIEADRSALRSLFAEIWHGVRRLRPESRRVVLVRYLQRDRSYSDVGLALGLTEDAVGRHVRAGLRAIWAQMDPDLKVRIGRLGQLPLQVPSLPGSHARMILKLLWCLKKPALWSVKKDMVTDLRRRIEGLPEDQRCAVLLWIETGHRADLDPVSSALALDGREAIVRDLRVEQPEWALLAPTVLANTCHDPLRRSANFEEALLQWAVQYVVGRLARPG